MITLDTKVLPSQLGDIPSGRIQPSGISGPLGSVVGLGWGVVGGVVAIDEQSPKSYKHSVVFKTSSQ